MSQHGLPETCAFVTSALVLAAGAQTPLATSHIRQVAVRVVHDVTGFRLRIPTGIPLLLGWLPAAFVLIGLLRSVHHAGAMALVNAGLGRLRSTECSVVWALLPDHSRTLSQQESRAADENGQSKIQHRTIQ